MSVDNEGATAIVLGPWITHGKPVLVGFPGGVPVEGERANRSRGTTLHFLRQTGVGHHESSLIEYKMADQAVDELGRPSRRTPVALRRAVRGSGRGRVAVVTLFAVEGTEQLDLVISGKAHRCSVRDHAHCQTEDCGRGRAPVDQISEEEQLDDRLDGVPWSPPRPTS